VLKKIIARESSSLFPIIDEKLLRLNILDSEIEKQRRVLAQTVLERDSLKSELNLLKFESKFNDKKRIITTQINCKRTRAIFNQQLDDIKFSDIEGLCSYVNPHNNRKCSRRSVEEFKDREYCNAHFNVVRYNDFSFN